jgi:hypothetical protein
VKAGSDIFANMEILKIRNSKFEIFHARLKGDSDLLDTGERPCFMMDLQAPSVLAQLPRPFEATTGSTQIGEVYSLIGSKKRKRHEVTAAIDGEGVNIYNVR